MTIKLRRLLFIFFVILFVIVGVAVLYYAKGFRIDFNNLSITKTGAVYVEAEPSDIEVYIGKKQYKDKSGILQKGTLISNIVPKKYIVLIKKEGYENYEKNIEVFPSQVVRLLNIKLVPKKIPSQPIINELKGDQIVDVSATKKIIIYDSQKSIYYLYDLSLPNGAPINLNLKISSLTKQKFDSIIFYPQTENAFIIRTPKGIFRADIISKELSPIHEGSVQFFTIRNNNLYSVYSPITKKVVTTSTLEIFDLVLNNKVSQIEMPFSSDKITDVYMNGGQIFVLEKGGSLSAKLDNKFVQIAHSAKKMALAPDNSKLFYQDIDGKIFVYLLRDELITLDAVKNSSLHLSIENSSKISSISWFYDNYHLICTYPDQIVLAEVTNKEPNNHFVLLKNTQNIFYDQNNKLIYSVDQKTLTVHDISLKSN